MPTVTSLKTLLQAQIAPGNPEEFLRLLTEADLRLLEFGRWRWCRGRVTLTPVDGYITLPADYASILGAQVNGAAKDIRDEAYEFTPDGAGDVDVGNGTTKLIDQGINDAGFRHYKVAGVLSDGTTVNCLCHFAPFALYDPELLDGAAPTDASDTTRCPDVSALKLTMRGIIFEEASDITTSSRYFATALRGLDSKERANRGGARQQFNLRPNGCGIRRIRSFR